MKAMLVDPWNTKELMYQMSIGLDLLVLGFKGHGLGQVVFDRSRGMGVRRGRSLSTVSLRPCSRSWRLSGISRWWT